MEELAYKAKELKDLMKEEIDKLESVVSGEARLQRCVLDKDWTELEGTIRLLQDLSREVAHIENSRNILYTEMRENLGLDSTDGFYDFLSRLPSEERNDLADLYRKLRLSVSEVRGITGGIDSYITASVSTMGRILEELFPARKDRLYDRNGTAQELRHPLVFSHCL